MSIQAPRQRRRLHTAQTLHNISQATRYFPPIDGSTSITAGSRMALNETLCLQIKCSGGVTVTIEATFGEAEKQESPTWIDITPLAFTASTNATGFASFVDANDIVWFPSIPIYRWRIKVVTSDATNDIELYELLVPVALSAPSTYTLSAISSKLPASLGAKTAAASLSVVQATDVGEPATQYHATTPGKADLAIGPIEVSSRGMTYINDTLRHRRKIPLLAAASHTAVAITLGTNTGWPLAEGHCDEIEVGTDGVIVFCQPPEKAKMLVDGTLTDAPKWTVPAGWAHDGAGHLTHTASGGTGAATQDTGATNPNDPVLSGETYLVAFKVTITAGTSLIVKLGTSASVAITATGTYAIAITANSAVLSFTPTNDLACVIEPLSATQPIWILPSTPVRYSGRLYRDACYLIGGVAAALAPDVLLSTCTVTAHWRRRAGAVGL